MVHAEYKSDCKYDEDNILYRILLCNIIEQFPSCASIPLSIHVLNKVASQLFLMMPSHALYLYLYIIPIYIGLYILSVGTSDGIHKFNGIIDSAVGAGICEWCNSFIRCPLIKPHSGTWYHMAVDNGQQSCCITLWHNLHVSQGWIMWTVNHAKNPNFISGWMPDTMLKEKLI